MERLTKEEETLLIKALTFFVDFKFDINTATHKNYIKIMQEEDNYEDYYNLCKKLGGKSRW